MMRRFLLFTAVVLLAMTRGAASVDETTVRLIDSISTCIDSYHQRQVERIEAIDSLKRERFAAPLTERRVQLGEQLGREYLDINIDSALIYWHLAIDDARKAELPDYVRRLQMHVLASLPRTGIVLEAVADFSKIDVSTLPRDLRHIYWLCAAEISYNIIRPYPEGEMRSRHVVSTIEVLDSLASYYPQNSPTYNYIKAQTHALRGEHNLAAACFMELLPSLKGQPKLYDRALGNIVKFYAGRRQYRQQYLHYLFERCVNELSHGYVSPEVMAMTGKELIDEGYTVTGRQLVNLAMSVDDVHQGPFYRFDRVPYAHYLLDTSRRQRIWNYVIMAVLIAAICVEAGVLIFRRRVIGDLNNRLSECRERYDRQMQDMLKVTGNVLGIALLADEQLKEYNLYVTRKLKAGQVKDLYHDVENGNFVRQLSDKFFLSFDETFLDSFPGFVDSLNTLLEPDKQLALLPGRRLTPELRIAAFLRLGVTDSAKLSQVLGLSVNTIYTYRNRLRGRAIDRASFENDVRKICFDA